MKAAIYQGPGAVEIHDVPDATLSRPTDAVVRVVRACVCGSDLWGYRGVLPNKPSGSRLGHEFIGVVEEVGAEVREVKVGDLVVAPFQWCDNTCETCRDGIQTSCPNTGTFGAAGADGGQGEAVRVPFADGTCVVVPGGMAACDEATLASLLALTDVAATGLHGAVLSGVERGDEVVVIGDGAVGLNAVLGASAVLGAERVVLVSTHDDRAALGREFGATDIVPARGDEGVEAVAALLGRKPKHVVEAVGNPDAWDMAIAMLRPGGTVGSVGVPHVRPELPLFPVLRGNLTVRAGLAPARHYLPDLLQRVLAGGYDPGRVFDLTLPFGEVAEAYRAMDERRSIKTMLAF
ncbi:zinc-binding dehydrogenase [Microbacterium sediminis]|uniref:IMP dehydrogenase n=1 Tax=Microbacterium sediminis TaxID=904291 RepID=A0A1B9NIP1_9MICO|nr:alcohol dehydrogenase catalytic domain-containing protein [Microbacterium sediminis]OCG76461.1 IMP dehydrogenase [Microbacterium sediminis]QBR73039.1 IMP dehydrogenase [Microbacterium sediminis]